MYTSYKTVIYLDGTFHSTHQGTKLKVQAENMIGEYDNMIHHEKADYMAYITLMSLFHPYVKLTRALEANIMCKQTRQGVTVVWFIYTS